MCEKAGALVNSTSIHLSSSLNDHVGFNVKPTYNGCGRERGLQRGRSAFRARLEDFESFDHLTAAVGRRLKLPSHNHNVC